MLVQDVQPGLRMTDPVNNIKVLHRLDCNGYSMNNVVDPAFKNIPKNSTAFLIWRVENMQLVALPKDQYGKFFDGDSYVIYAASDYGQPCGMDTVVREVKTGLEIHIHFWLGTNTSIDEMGVATIKTVELDDYLGGNPIQHREVQGNESDRFKAYFPAGLRTMSGGVASGFKEVTDTHETRLFRVKGRKNPTVTQMPSISWEHINSGDIFILDTKNVVFVWVGITANHAEKVQGARTAQKMKDEHDAIAIVFIDEGKENQMLPAEKVVFEHHLSLKEKKVQTAKEAGEDEKEESVVRATVKLYRCSDEDGTYKVEEVKTGPLLQSDLNSQDSFIVDNGASGIWVWVGRKASQKERTEAMRNAHGFVTKKGYPDNTKVTRVIDQGEPTEFKLLFTSWQDKSQIQGFGKTNTVGRVAKTVQTKFDATTLHDQPQLAADSQLIDDGSGKRQVWRLENFELVEVPERMQGIFFAGDAYLVLYSYFTGSSEKYVLYFWLGDHCGIDERGAVALKAVEKDDELGGAAVQVRVVQGKEPAHFLTIFHGKMVILEGGKASAFDEDEEDTGIPKEFLLQVRGNQSHNTRAVQVDLQGSSLNSNDVFVLKTSTACYVWCGKGSSGDEREMAKAVANIVVKGEYTLVMEGQEKDDFWTDIGGKEEYASSRVLAEPGDKMPPRLFQCSNVTGNFKAEEVMNFVQSDLVPEDVMLLDARDAIFVWIGRDSNEAERKLAIQTAIEYLKSDPTQRDLDTPILQVKQSHEPPTFTGFFGIWDDDLWDETSSSFDDLRRDITGQNEVIEINKMAAISSELGFDNAPKYPLETLRVDNESLPEDVDKTHKEHHLNATDFHSLFGMDYPQFAELPTWRQIKLKKDAKIF